MSAKMQPKRARTDQIIHPRPSSIVAALYTLRDLEADVVIIHGPSGCCFKHSRLLEEDGIRVITTAMDETNFVFGGDKALRNVIRRAVELFNPSLLGVIGSCASMIIGEDIHQAVVEANPPCSVIEVEIHAGYRDNTYGAIATLVAAARAGVLDATECKRQTELLVQATDLEKMSGVASLEYIPPSRGDTKYTTARNLLTLIKHKKKGFVVLNAKKETAYQFADILVAISKIADASGNQHLGNLANLDVSVGLPRLRRHAENILNDLSESGVTIDHITGGLDEYPVTGRRAGRLIDQHYSDYDFAVLLGVPHAVPMTSLEQKIIFSVTNGPRQVLPLKQLGHKYVTVEIDLHPRTLGVSHIVPSELGDTMRAIFLESNG
ncbi:MAG TPA: Ni-sirohydrochlorin a,c-diamide reductive cyclase catalytic subunit [Candidatus Acidoferrales bacterium]|nr:Ni-sirohydrochlorin a,c-diamide reductive cyclase catalytic subunit [Candidatus Acidoferrales bacterium]